MRNVSRWWQGTWSLRPKGQSTEIAGGTFALKK
jgi:hypothetical protein